MKTGKSVTIPTTCVLGPSGENTDRNDSIMTDTPRMAGVVIRILQDKGFGFIRGIDRITRYFHAKDVEPRVDFDLMDVGQSVDFTSIDMGVDNPAMKKGNGLRAAQVRRM